MNLLLKANFSRLWKDGAFWASLAVMEIGRAHV